MKPNDTIIYILKLTLNKINAQLSVQLYLP